MNHLDRNTRSTIRRILKYGSTLLAVCGLVGLALVTFASEPSATATTAMIPHLNSALSASGSIPPRLSAPLPVGGAASSTQRTPVALGPGGNPIPLEMHLDKAHVFTGDLRTLPYAKPDKQERLELEGPVPNPIPLPGTSDSAANAAAPAAPAAPSAAAPRRSLPFTAWTTPPGAPVTRPTRTAMLARNTTSRRSTPRSVSTTRPRALTWRLSLLTRL